MKSQRRHELQENQLAKVIVGAPSYWQQFGGRAFFIVVAILAVALLVRYRINSARADVSRATTAISEARQQIADLQTLELYNMPPAQIARRRASMFADGSSLVEEVSRLSANKSLLAQNQIVKGDLNWTAYNLPELPGATTQPDLKISQDPGELLTAATDAYQTVLDKYPDQKQAVIAAHFGLAAINENRQDWNAAKAQYEKIIQTPQIAQAYLDQARYRLDKLAEIRQPVFLAEPATMPIAAIPASAAPGAKTASATARPLSTPVTVPPHTSGGHSAQTTAPAH